MKKIPTVFVRDLTTHRVIDTRVPGCEWVGDISVPQIATRKYDGTCMRCDADGMWWSRREVKAGKAWPDDFEPVDGDTTTGKLVGWVPVTPDSQYAYAWAEAIGDTDPSTWKEATYELCGPKVNDNPERWSAHQLVEHGRDMLFDAPTEFNALKSYFEWFRGEGIVWWAQDGRMAKAKRRDFGWH